MPAKCFHVPPNISTHLFGGEAPGVYSYFIIFGMISLIITAILICPRMIQFWKLGRTVREQKDKILMPFSHTVCLLIVSFPLVGSMLKFWIFISPLSTFTIDFIIHGYEGIVLYAFARLLMMFLGSRKNLINALNQAPPTKFWAVLPVACLFKPICKARHVSKKNFRLIYRMMLQYAFVGPILSFNELLQNFGGSNRSILTIQSLQFLSALICIYGLFALLKASHFILAKFNPHGKFFCIKLIVFVMVTPEFLIRVLDKLNGGVNGINDEYDESVMSEAYSAIIAMWCFTVLSYFFRKYFTVYDATKAEKNQKERRCSINLEAIQQQNVKNGRTSSKERIKDNEDDDVELSTLEEIEETDQIDNDNDTNNQNNSDIK